MAEIRGKSQGTQPPPHLLAGHQAGSSHPQPRRTSPHNSVTLGNHRLARDAALRASACSAQNNQTSLSSSPRRNSSGESYSTSKSDPKKWFDQSNANATATFNHGAMDVDPPFFQKETDSSNDDKPYRHAHLQPPPKLGTAQSSSAEDYRSVIDDLTVEIKKLKDELKRYKQQGPDMLRKDKLFEIKIHGLPKKKKRELETTLRDFAASLKDSPDASSSHRDKRPKHRNGKPAYARSGSASKHASSSSGSNFRPVDSAYASASTGANSSGASFSRAALSARAGSFEQPAENTLRDVPEGLYPRHTIMTDREKKKLVIRRLEHIFTGKFSGRFARRTKSQQLPQATAAAPTIVDPTTQQPSQPKSITSSLLHRQQSQAGSTVPELSREARILPVGNSKDRTKSRSIVNGPNSQSQGDNTELDGNGNSSERGTNLSTPSKSPPEQRATCLRDLDPDRTQNPSENMEYIRHLGLIPPELLPEHTYGDDEIRPDTDGWVWLNLLSSMAQLHILNVTPDFVRSAVNEISNKLQLSHDGRKIRWRGGTEGTRFGSDESGASSQRQPDTEETESSDDPRKRRKVGTFAENDYQSGSSSKNQSKFGPQITGSSESIHYKPLFVHRESSQEQTSLDDTLSSFGPIEDSNVGDSRWGPSGSGNSARRKRRHDGAIIYYTGAPFCTDLAGDTGDVSPTAHMISNNLEQQTSEIQPSYLPHWQSSSGSSLNTRPISEMHQDFGQSSKMDLSEDIIPELSTDSSDVGSDTDMDFPWSTEQQYMEIQSFEPCGLGGVVPEDHFMVLVTTKRPKNSSIPLRSSSVTPGEAADVIANRLATMSTASPVPPHSRSSMAMPLAIEIEYTSGRIKRLTPASLPPPALFYPPFSPSSADDDDYLTSDADDDGDSASSDVILSRLVNAQRPDGYPDDVELSSGDEDGEDPDDEPDSQHMYNAHSTLTDRRRQPIRRPSSGSIHAVSGTARNRSASASADVQLPRGGSSAATAGGVESGYSSSREHSS